jgi:PTS system nitrogen regulatory IIA component
VTLCFLERPVDFDALDGKPVEALFTIISPTLRAHVNLLSRLCFGLRDTAFRTLVHQQAGREELFGAMRRISDSYPAPASAAPTSS